MSVMKAKPNLLFIYTDEQAINTLGTYGNDIIDTPNLDRLAEESMVFGNPYVTQPVCTPSRSSLLTGLYPHTSGCTENNIPLSSDIPCLPEMGDFSGYRTAHHGKWHLGDEVFAQHGFEDWISIEDMYREYYTENRDKTKHSTYTDYLIGEGFKPDIKMEDGYKAFSRNFCARLPERYSKPAFLGRKASKFVEKNQDKPFILYVNFLEPHMPYFSCRNDQYSPEEVTLPKNFNHELGADVPLKPRLFQGGYYENGHSGLSLKTEENWQQMISNYWGLVSLVDTHVGKILDTLERTGQKENTIIVFTSDHGDMMGAHKLLAKCTMFEEAVKVPLLLKIPGMEHKRIKKPVSQIDLIPTLLEAMNQDIPAHLEGYSWLPFLQNDGNLKEKDVFIEWNGPNSGFGNEVGGNPRILDCWQEMVDKSEAEKAIKVPVRTVITSDRWKFNWRKYGVNQLYNLQEDPYEKENLALDDSCKNLIKELKKKIRNWQQRTGDIIDFDKQDS